MIAAMERALADDMDVLNMSIGSAFNTWPQYPTADAADACVNAGVVVVASIGNSGANGRLLGRSSRRRRQRHRRRVVRQRRASAAADFTVTPAYVTIGYEQRRGRAAARPTSGSLP